MDKIFYQPNDLWKGQKAVENLRELSGEKSKVIKQWLSLQAFWQVHLPAKRVDRSHYEVTTSTGISLTISSDELEPTRFDSI